MKMYQKILMALLSLSLTTTMTAQDEGNERTPAFPGAEGYGGM